MLHRSVNTYGNNSNFSFATLNTYLESAVLGQCPGNWEHKQAEGSDQAQSGPETDKLGRTMKGSLVDLKKVSYS